MLPLPPSSPQHGRGLQQRLRPGATLASEDLLKITFTVGRKAPFKVRGSGTLGLKKRTPPSGICCFKRFTEDRVSQVFFSVRRTACSVVRGTSVLKKGTATSGFNLKGLSEDHLSQVFFSVRRPASSEVRGTSVLKKKTATSGFSHFKRVYPPEVGLLRRSKGSLELRINNDGRGGHLLHPGPPRCLHHPYCVHGSECSDSGLLAMSVTRYTIHSIVKKN